MVAMVFTEATLHSIRKGSLPSSALLTLDPSFTTMASTMYTLLGLVLGGADWLTYADAVKAIHPMYKLCLMGYIVFTQLALLNVVTAIFVDSSMNAAMSDKQMLIQEELMREGVNKKELEHIFQEASEGARQVSVEQLKEFLSDRRVSTYMRVLDIHYNVPDELCSLLDADHNGTVDCDEFVRGCWALQTQHMTDVASKLNSIDKSVKSFRTSLQMNKELDKPKVPCDQLRDACNELHHAQCILSNLSTNLQRTTTDMNHMCSELQHGISIQSDTKANQLPLELHEELHQFREVVTQRIDTLLASLNQHEGALKAFTSHSFNSHTSQQEGALKALAGHSLDSHATQTDWMKAPPGVFELWEETQKEPELEEVHDLTTPGLGPQCDNSGPELQRVRKLEKPKLGPQFEALPSRLLQVQTGDLDDPPRPPNFEYPQRSRDCWITASSHQKSESAWSCMDRVK